MRGCRNNICVVLKILSELKRKVTHSLFVSSIMEEAGICGLREKADMLCNSESNDILQHQDSNYSATNNKHLLEDREGSDFITKNRSWVSPVSRNELPAQEVTPPRGQQDLQCNRNKEKVLGKEVLLLMQALNTLSTPEEKLAALCKKCADLLEESRNVQRQMKILQNKQAQIVKEKVHLQSEHSKTILARSKLESLCRELQRQNKTLKEEYMQQKKEEEEGLKEVTAHFQITLTEIQAQLEQHEIHNAKVQQENVEMEEKLKKLTDQYALREEQINKAFKHKELQQQLVDARLQQTAQLIKEADERHQREREFLLKEATESRHKYEKMKQEEAQLKERLFLYMDKFEEFQTTMAKTNELFTAFKQETEKKTIRDRNCKVFQIKLERLEKLYKALQMERNELSEKVEVLKGQASVKVADADLAVPVMHSCADLDSSNMLNTSSKRVPGVHLEADPKGMNEAKCYSKGPLHGISRH
ncbi:gamma-taxilin-like isoform X4 [Rhinopithecus roxellana]|uniref:gamma-taxilin-like isoform X4 n=1 Tax=Rhinopithecus roxellana TaxID=61622 RepID=UPI0012374092|nr:gamma-taxilin-like isoform X4 [Rhinopithecus roxellana]